LRGKQASTPLDHGKRYLPPKEDDLDAYIMSAAEGDASVAASIKTRLSAITPILREIAPHVAPFDFQAEVIDDFRTKFIVWKKPRQVGASYSFAVKALGKGLGVPGARSLFLSLNLDDAREKIDYAKEVYRALQDARAPMPGLTNESKTMLEFENGSRLQAVFYPRGKTRADIYMDELAHHPQARKIYRASLPILTTGGQCAVASTVLAKGTLFSEIWDGATGVTDNFRVFKPVETHWWDSPLHCTDVRLARELAAGMPTIERVNRFGTDMLQGIFQAMILEDFMCEYELEELGESDSWLAWQLILDCTPAGEDAVEPWGLEELGKYLLDHPSARAFAGYDVGRMVDAAEFSCLLMDGAHGVEKVARTFKRIPFAEQQKFLEGYLSLPRTHLAIDETGMGLPISEALRQRFRQRVRGINFAATIDVPCRYQDRTATAKTALAVVLKTCMLDGEVLWQIDKGKNAQMYCIKRSITESANLVFKVDTGTTEYGHHHADVFWARALACWCWKMNTHRGKIEIRVYGGKKNGAAQQEEAPITGVNA
jgi:phage FluMu gp28-like protein